MTVNPKMRNMQEMIYGPINPENRKAIKSWDVNVPESYGGYCGANGSHAKLILDAIRSVSDGSLKGQDAKQPDPKDDSAVCGAETPNNQSGNPANPI